MNLISDRTTPTGRVWAQIMGDARKVGDKPRRKARFTGDVSEKKRWVRMMSAGPGRFFETARQPNWSNIKPFWAKKKKITDIQFAVAHAETKQLSWLQKAHVKPPYFVTLTRYGPKAMDRDGNVAALKHFQDGVAAALGVDDGDRSKIDWDYRQLQTRKAGWYGVRIVIGHPEGGRA